MAQCDIRHRLARERVIASLPHEIGAQYAAAQLESHIAQVCCDHLRSLSDVDRERASAFGIQPGTTHMDPMKLDLSAG
jgi:hypothetical protein